MYLRCQFGQDVFSQASVHLWTEGLQHSWSVWRGINTVRSVRSCMADHCMAATCEDMEDMRAVSVPEANLAKKTELLLECTYLLDPLLLR